MRRLSARRTGAQARRFTNGLLAATGALALAAGCWRNPAPPARPPAKQAVAAIFVGAAACAECHPDIARRQSRSRHAGTLTLLSRKRLGKLAPPAGRIPGTGLLVAEKADRFAVGFSARPADVAPIHYALGSGKTGMTYISLVGGDSLAEFRMSYFPRQKSVKWYVTPGHEGLAADALGRVRSGGEARRCILCHAVTLSPGTLAPEERFLGVGCEACHGPGGAHITEMQTGDGRGAAMKRLGGLPASDLNALCGRCHGTEQDASAEGLSQNATNRLQTFGLERSRCFRESRDTLSCITCHDPHTNVSTNEKAYEAVCLRCHAAPASPARPAPLRAVAIQACPVNPKNNCVRCHMPTRPAIAGSPVPTRMADHFIRVIRAQGARR